MFKTIQEKIAVMQAYVDGADIERNDGTGTGWQKIEDPIFIWGKFYYRVALVDDQIDWEHVHPDYICMARDSDGTAYVYEEQPVMGVRQYRPSHKSYCAPASRAFASYKRGNKPWDQSLVWRPGCEPEGGE